jgi:long-subunit fatty acid transport protein
LKNMRLAGASFLFWAAFTALLPAAARAGGYDTPMLYSARHMGMGGTAIGYVDDPSAMFHNPAGLGHTNRLGVTADFSLLLAKVHTTPNIRAKDVDSELTVAPLFLLGGGLRVHKLVTVGLGVFPIAMAGATYKYPATNATIEDRTRLVFLEVTPGLALNLPGRVRVGAGYRVTYVSIERYQGVPDQPMTQAALDFSMTGLNWKGFRVGAQWSALDWLQFGAVYRHKILTRVSNDQGHALVDFVNIETKFLLPSKLGVGARVDPGPVGIAIDGEYTFNSQNDSFDLSGMMVPAPPPDMPFPPVPNVFDWKDEITVRAGLEYRLLGEPTRRRLALRGGYVYDGKTTNPQYPSAFGTPPGPTHVFTLGAGWRGNSWQVNAAFARRAGSGAVSATELAMAPRRCAFCGQAGDDPYRIGVNGLYVDFSYAY